MIMINGQPQRSYRENVVLCEIQKEMIQYHITSDIPVPHYNDVIMGVMASEITSLTIVYSTVYSGADQRKHQSPA